MFSSRDNDVQIPGALWLADGSHDYLWSWAKSGSSTCQRTQPEPVPMPTGRAAWTSSMRRTCTRERGEGGERNQNSGFWMYFRGQEFRYDDSAFLPRCFRTRSRPQTRETFLEMRSGRQINGFDVKSDVRAETVTAYWSRRIVSHRMALTRSLRSFHQFRRLFLVISRWEFNIGCVRFCRFARVCERERKFCLYNVKST